ncbi:hypothetical protein PS861_01475 [Pseudomonas fluorescens]|nr:hypothetical protein PS861_01475 [Pseudomonas fluorescens]
MLSGKASREVEVKESLYYWMRVYMYWRIDNTKLLIIIIVRMCYSKMSESFLSGKGTGRPRALLLFYVIWLSLMADRPLAGESDLSARGKWISAL